MKVYLKKGKHRITQKVYYHYMNNFGNLKFPFSEILDRWFACFLWALKHWHKDAKWTKATAISLFCDWEMQCVRDGFDGDVSKRKLKEEFAGACAYMCDRVSYDRLFDAHLTFRKAYDKEIDDLRKG